MKDQVAIIGDIHGESEAFQQLLLKIKEVDSDIQVYSLGDMIDRGPDSKGVIQLCIDYNVKAQLGNHELWLRNLICNGIFEPYALREIMGGVETFISYGVTNFKDNTSAAINLYNNIPEEHKSFISELQPYRKLTISNTIYWLIHSGLTNISASKFLKNSESLSDDNLIRAICDKDPYNYLLWNSPDFSSSKQSYGKLYTFNEGVQVLGHKPVSKPIISDKYIAIDTGCGTCNPNILSAVLLPSKRIIQAKV